MIESGSGIHLELLQIELSTFVDCVCYGHPFQITLREGTANLGVFERMSKCIAVGTLSGFWGPFNMGARLLIDYGDITTYDGCG